MAATTDASSGSAGVVIPLLVVVATCLALFWALVLIDALSWPRATWSEAGISRARWVMRVVVLGPLGALLYLRGPRRRLRAAYQLIRTA